MATTLQQRYPSLRTFGRNVCRLRTAAGLTQEKLAERADLDPTYISQIECGTRGPGIINVVRLARALDVTVDALCQDM